MHDTEWPDGLCVVPEGKNIVGHVGGPHLRLLAQRTGLTTALSTALKPTRPRSWDRGQIMADLACAITLGATNIRDISLLDHHRPVIGPTASIATTWRMLDATGPRRLARIARARAAVRRHVWNLLDQRPDGFPQVRIDGAPLTGVTVIDSDATIIESASAKQGARGTFKGTYGHHPLTAYCANTHEMLVADLREGSAAPNHPGDNIAVLHAAVDQVPGSYRRRVLLRLDGAGASKDLLGWIASAGAAPAPATPGSTQPDGPSANASRPRSRPWTGSGCGRPPQAPTGRHARAASWPTSPACSATCTTGPRATGSSCAQNPCTRATNAAPPTTRNAPGSATRRFPPTPRAGRPRSSMPGTATTPRWNSASATPKPADWAGCPPATPTSTPPGCAR